MFMVPFPYRFNDRTERGVDREGHCRGGVQTQKRDGFTKSTSVHAYGPDFDTTQTIKRLEPYVARLVQCFFCLCLRYIGCLT